MSVKPGTAPRFLNDKTAALVAKYPDKLAFMAMVNPLADSGISHHVMTSKLELSLDFVKELQHITPQISKKKD